MKKDSCSHQHLGPLHPIESLGILKVSLSSIRIERLEDRIKPKVPFPHKHDFFQIIFIQRGSGRHKIDFHDHKVVPQQIFVIKPGQVHSWELRKEIKGFVVEFNRHSIDAIFQHMPDLMAPLFYSPDCIVIQEKRLFSELWDTAEMMSRQFKCEGTYAEVGVKGFLMGLLVQLLQQSQAPRGDRASSISTLDQFRELVEEHFREHHRVEFYAKELKLTPKALTMQISRLLGKSPRAIIQERCLLEAKRYLVYTDLSSGEIGFKLGFDDANYFTRFFRLHEKTTPAKFRKKSRPLKNA